MFCIRLLIPDNTVEDMNNVMLLRHGLTNITKLTSGVGGEGTFDSMPTPWDPARPQPTNLVHPPPPRNWDRPSMVDGTSSPGCNQQTGRGGHRVAGLELVGPSDVAMLSFVQHKSPEIVCTLEVTYEPVEFEK